MDSTKKTNKYKLLLLELIGVASKQITYTIEFSFMNCEKEDNLNSTLDMCRILLKDLDKMLHVIAIDHL